MRRTGCWMAIALLGLLAGPKARAQEVEADPPDVYLRIRGPVSVSGGFPLPLPLFPQGQYDYAAYGLGLASPRGHFLRTETGLVTKSWASGLALLQPPGVPHLIRHDNRGWYHLLAGLTSGAFLLVKTLDIDDAQTRVNRARRALDMAGTPEEVLEAEILLRGATAEKNDTRTVRNLWAAYFGAVWLGSGLEAWLFNPSPDIVTTADGRRVVVFPRANRWGATFRSLLVPGSGQRYLGHDTRATVLSGSVAFLGAWTIFAQNKFLQKSRDAEAAEARVDLASDEEFQRARAQARELADDRNFWSDIRWVMTGITASAYLWNVIDAFLVGSNAQSHAPPFTVMASPSAVGLRFAFDLP